MSLLTSSWSLPQTLRMNLDAPSLLMFSGVDEGVCYLFLFGWSGGPLEQYSHWDIFGIREESNDVILSEKVIFPRLHLFKSATQSFNQ